ncbi:MAG: pyrroline-5-carboxylate reductase [Alphaproteobacteria bacterium]|jgi:pyrroline-5-carboxylate reductase|nr:pyrroline-5-carboxylate reductase [Alphaproteobacteria bacterium]
MKRTKFLLVGCGAMGGALKAGWERVNAPFDVVVIEPSNSQYLPDFAALPGDYIPEMIIFAVKPQVLPEILPNYCRFSGQGCLFLSIAAGVPLEAFHKVLGEKESIIRAMPNLPVTEGQGIAVLTTRHLLSESHRSMGQAIFEASGKVLWLDKESLMDVVTAISGSGPAYFFRMVECLAQAGIVCGLPPEVAMQLARQTAVGAGAMLQHSSETATDLRIRVTSPGGTTAAALSAFDHQDALGKLVRVAVKAAIHRGQELSQ